MSVAALRARVGVFVGHAVYMPAQEVTAGVGFWHEASFVHKDKKRRK